MLSANEVVENKSLPWNSFHDAVNCCFYKITYVQLGERAAILHILQRESQEMGLGVEIGHCYV